MDMSNILVVKYADDVGDGVRFADVGQEFIAQPFALRSALDKAGDVNELYRRVNFFL